MRIPRRQYADLFGPTVGDRVRLADTDLLIEIEKDFTSYGDEAVFGGGKVLRDGMGQSARATNAEGALDTVITNALILDYWGIVKADIGIKDGRIVGIGKAGNPDTMPHVSPAMAFLSQYRPYFAYASAGWDTVASSSPLRMAASSCGMPSLDTSTMCFGSPTGKNRFLRLRACSVGAR